MTRPDPCAPPPRAPAPAVPPPRRRDHAQARAQVLHMLVQDHHAIRKGMHEVAQLDARADPAERARLVAGVCALLQDHAELEQAFFYAAARAALPEPDLVITAEVEHDALAALTQRLQALPPGDERVAPTFQVLCDYFRHHVKEEEGKLFRRLARTVLDWPALLAQMQASRLARSSQWGPDLHEALQADAPAALTAH